MTDHPNIFEMYYANGKRAGFWVKRDSWAHMVAKVISIGGIEFGPLTGLGRYPFFNDAKDAVFAEVYKLVRTEDGYLFIQELPIFERCPTDQKLSVLSCPGTYAYTKLDLSGKNISIQKIGWDTPKALTKPTRPLFQSRRNGVSPTAEDLAIAPTLAGRHGALEVLYSQETESFMIRFPYSASIVECIKSAPPSMRAFNADKKTWILDVTCVSTVVNLIAARNVV